jgi:hypothetical protein
LSQLPSSTQRGSSAFQIECLERLHKQAFDFS